jgi:hypothetical protein
MLVECSVSAQFYSLWQQLPSAQELASIFLSANVSLPNQGAATCIWGQNITFTFLRDPVSVGPAGHLSVKRNMLLLAAHILASASETVNMADIMHAVRLLLY